MTGFLIIAFITVAVFALIALINVWYAKKHPERIEQLKTQHRPATSVRSGSAAFSDMTSFSSSPSARRLSGRP